MDPEPFLRAFAAGFITNTARPEDLATMSVRDIQKQLILEEIHQCSGECITPGLLQAFDVRALVGTCCACGCTEEEACEGGCSWVDNRKTLCSSCMGMPA